MEKKESRKKSLKLSQPIVHRSVPMTEQGSDRLRAIRDHILKDLLEKTGVDYRAPFPVIFHMVLKEYCEMKGIEINGNTDSSKHPESD